MAYKLYGNMRFIPCNDTLENWETENPVLGPGEWGAVIGVNEAGDELDTVERIKVGDGVTPWNDLPWWSGPQGPKGDKGDKGDIGEQGPKGDKGDAGVIKFVVVNSLPDENIENAIYLLPVEGGAAADLFEEYIYIDGRWELLGSAGVEVNLDEYVKNTDYATTDKAGLVVINRVWGIEPTSYTGSGKGALRLVPVTNSDIDDRVSNRAISPKFLDYAVKAGLTTNTEEWTDEDKTAARELIGAIGNDDYATTDKAGVVKIGGGNETGITVKDGKLALTGVTEHVITHPKSYQVALRSCDIYKWFRTGMTTNDIELTDEEKATACEWLGVNALAIPNTIVDGGKSLTVNDVSPLAHKCSLQLVSDTYEEVSNNILGVLDIAFGNYFGLEMPTMNGVLNDNGSIVAGGIMSQYPDYFAIVRIGNLEEGKTYTFSVRNNERSVNYVVVPIDANGIPYDETEGSEKFTFTHTSKYSFYDFRIHLFHNETESDLTFEETTFYLQLEEGSEMTEWQPRGGETKPYIDNLSRVAVNVNGTEYIPEPDGTLANIESVSPTMEITLGGVLAEYANITNFTYLVDTKKYIDGSVGNIETALDNIIAIQERTIALQESLIGGDVE